MSVDVPLPDPCDALMTFVVRACSSTGVESEDSNSVFYQVIRPVHDADGDCIVDGTDLASFSNEYGAGIKGEILVTGEEIDIGEIGL